MKMRILVTAFGIATLCQAAAANEICRALAGKHYSDAMMTCRRTAERIKCSAYCDHFYENPLSQMIDVSKIEAHGACYRTRQLPCEIERDFARNECEQVAERRLHDDWKGCSFDNVEQAVSGPLLAPLLE